MWVALVIIIMCLSGLDSFSTYLALHRLPDDLKAHESNTLMLKLMNKNSILADVVKQLVTLGLVLVMYFSENLYGLELITVLLALVVASNFYTYFGRVITHKKISSPLYHLYLLTHLPEKAFFWVMMPVLVLVAVMIVRVVNL